MLNNLRHWLFLYAKHNMKPREVIFMNYSKVRSVVLVFNQQHCKETDRIVRRLEQDGMMVEIVGYDPKNDFTFLGKMKKEAQAALPSQRADLLIDLSTTYYPGTQHILMALDATFKTGMRFPNVPENEQQGILDMMVSLPEPDTQQDYRCEQIAEQVIRYMKMINA